MTEEKLSYDYYHQETQGEKFARKSKESPFMIMGIAGFLGAVGYGVYKFKARGSMSPSVFVMQFRVIAQGTAVGALTAGMAYTLYSNHFKKSSSPTHDQIILKSNEH